MKLATFIGTIAAGVALVLFTGRAHAQLPHVRLDRTFPLGGKAGSQVVLEIAGKDLDDVRTLHFDHPGFKSEFVKSNQFRVTIAADVSPGTYEVRAIGKYGISGSRLFAVSHGLTEVAETEPNDTPDKAQSVPVNVAINATSDGDGDDFYRFSARKGERLVIDCQALRLDSTMRAAMTLSHADGRPLVQSKPYYARTDPLLDFVAPDDGDYVLGLHDAAYAGGLPYRLLISNRPHIENVYPAAVTPGETVELTVLGRNLPGGKPAPERAVDGVPVEQVTVRFTAPTDPLRLQRFEFLQHLPSPCLNARGLHVRPRGLENALNPVALLYATAPVTREREPNNTADAAQEIALPTVISGRFDRPGDADWYTFTAKAGQTVAVDLFCERLEMPGDPFVLVTDAKGNELATIDDHGINFNALAQFNRDPVGTFNVPADGKYRLLVQDRYKNGGARFQYVLHLGKPEPDFYPVAFHETPVAPSCPVVGRGGSAFCELCLNRRNFNGPVTVEAENLLPGVACPPVHVSPQTEFAQIVFTAAADAAEWAGPIRLKAWAVIDGKRIEREVRCCQRRWNIDNINTSRICREICLAVRAQAPYAIKLPAEPVRVAAGATLETKVKLERLWPDFKGKVQLNGLTVPPGFGFASVDVAPDKTQATVKWTVAANVPPGTYTLVLRGDAQVPFSPDPKVASRPNVRVADSSTPMTVLVVAAKRQ